MQKPYKLNNRRLRSFLLNFGPQHPAAHGILKIGLVLVGDLVVRADPQFGLLHRGSEKLTETRTLYSSLPYLDRMDYVANIIQEQSFVSAVESSFSLIPNYNINVLRIIFNEFSRILNHLLTVSAICLDMGSMGPIF
jgi:NADH-quinone oxidoreductase subunit D